MDPPASPDPAGNQAAAAGAPGSAPAAAPAPTSPPDRVRIPALGVDAAVTPVGVAQDGEVEVPEDVSTVGWYRFGPVPGAGGSSVLVGHVDDYRQGVGVLARIGDLNPGDTVEIAGADGSVRGFTVVAREQWNKTEVPLDRLFDRGGESRLVLLTCGGAFDDSRLGYTDNIAVTAIPATS
ncbi:class F sortase [Nakamurella sp.]|uniref:class F sortase n=1 Tax=Nakamurella sp. TaxID=1869182 RepID=UPI003B3B82E0